MHFGSLAKSFSLLAVAAAISFAPSPQPLLAQFLDRTRAIKAHPVRQASRRGRCRRYSRHPGGECSANVIRSTWTPTAIRWSCRPATTSNVRAAALAVVRVIAGTVTAGLAVARPVPIADL